MIDDTAVFRSAWSSTGRATLSLATIVAATLLPLGVATEADAGPRVTILDRPSPATAMWGLEALPGVTREQALADRQPASGGDSPLTGTSISWQDDARLLGVQTVAFDGASSSLSASPSTLDTAGTFSLATWVRLTDTSVSRVFASKAGTHGATFSVGYDKASNRWQVRMPSKSGNRGRLAVARSTSTPAIGLWTHLAVVHDAAAHTLTLRVDGVAESVAGNVTGVNDPAGEFRLGRGDTAWWQGNLAEARVYDRALVGQDFTGWFAADPASGGFSEPGLLRAPLVGWWYFGGGTSCYEEDLDPTLCSVPDSSAFGRQLALTKGSFITDSARGPALDLDDRHWIDDPSDPHFGEATQEYGRTQINLGEPQNPVWQDGPVLRTDQSFTVSTWVRLDPARGAQSVLSQDDGDRSVFRLAYEPADGGRWVFRVSAGADDSATTTATAPATGVDQWHQLVAVLDATHRQVRLYVDGTSAGAVGLHPAWQLHQATGSLLVGRSTASAGPDGWLYGQLSDLGVYQGVFSDADVQRHYAEQQIREPGLS
ncbi:LamG domain-containing protein [Micromonospora sp. NBC_00421]|uniref:LamG domain-containing protein n=1 Tax=Micromonospora sp. NBC_00421 TaxID=2975976 RepID=UPI002E21AF10